MALSHKIQGTLEVHPETSHISFNNDNLLVVARPNSKNFRSVYRVSVDYRTARPLNGRQISRAIALFDPTLQHTEGSVKQLHHGDFVTSYASVRGAAEQYAREKASLGGIFERVSIDPMDQGDVTLKHILSTSRIDNGSGKEICYQVGLYKDGISVHLSSDTDNPSAAFSYDPERLAAIPTGMIDRLGDFVHAHLGVKVDGATPPFKPQ